ncbi:MAG: alpha/beta hydrolase [Pirellulales bacterium]
MDVANPNDVLEPAAKKLLDDIIATGAPPIYTLTPPAAREALAICQRVPVHLPPTTVEDTTFPVGPNGSVRIRIVRPEGATGVLPVVMFFHGGGWMLGDVETHDRLIRDLAHGSQAAVVFVDYDRTPEVKFPIANEQAYAATKYVAEHGGKLGLDPRRIAVAGDSAGGNMAIAVSLLAKERGGPRLAFQLLYYPLTDQSMSQESYATFAEGFWLTTEAMHWFWDAYLPDKSARRQIAVSPINATADQLRGLPPTLLIVSENDVLRDEGEAFARKLMHAGVSVASTRYNATIHDFVMINAIAETPQARGAIAQGVAALRAAFHI